MNLDTRILLAGAAISLIALFPFDASFYMVTRIAICLCAIYGAYYLNQKNHALWFVMAFIALFYNPIMPVYLYDRGLWEIANLITILIFLYSYSLYDLSDRGKIYFLYGGRIILILALTFSCLLLLSGFMAGIFNPQSRAYMGFWGLMIIFACAAGTIIVTKLWNYFFLGNAKFQLKKDDLDINVK